MHDLWALLIDEARFVYLNNSRIICIVFNDLHQRLILWIIESPRLQQSWKKDNWTRNSKNDKQNRRFVKKIKKIIQTKVQWMNFNERYSNKRWGIFNWTFDRSISIFFFSCDKTCLSFDYISTKISSELPFLREIFIQKYSIFKIKIWILPEFEYLMVVKCFQNQLKVELKGSMNRLLYWK